MLESQQWQKPPKITRDPADALHFPDVETAAQLSEALNAQFCTLAMYNFRPRPLGDGQALIEAMNVGTKWTWAGFIQKRGQIQNDVSRRNEVSAA